VLVLFAGVGPFVVPAAARGARVVAVEKNPAACRWLSANCRTNGVDGRVCVHETDAASLPGLCPTSFDRAVIPTPYGMDGMFSRIAPMVRRGGMIHFYTFKKRHQFPGLLRGFEEEGYDCPHRPPVRQRGAVREPLGVRPEEVMIGRLYPPHGHDVERHFVR